MQTDHALASLRVWAIEVDLGGQTYVVPPRPAGAWMLAVLSNDDAPIVPGLLTAEEQEEIIDRLLAGEITRAELERINREALEAAAGWKWWEAERLIVSAAVEWRVIGGLLLGQGIDPDVVSLGALLSAIYALAVTHMTKEDRFTFDAQVSAPPSGGQVAAKELYEAQADRYQDAFAELLAARQKLPGVRKTDDGAAGT